MTIVIIFYHSGYGHTKLQAEAVHQGVASVSGVDAVLMTTEEALARLDEFDRADGIIFGCPTYLGSMSAEMKKFLEAGIKKWFAEAWKDKIAGAFTNSSSFSGDKLNTLVGLFLATMQHSMIYVGLGLLPSADHNEDMNSVEGPKPETMNRLGSFAGAMAASFQVKQPDAPPKGDYSPQNIMGVESQKSHSNSFEVDQWYPHKLSKTVQRFASLAASNLSDLANHVYAVGVQASCYVTADLALSKFSGKTFGNDIDYLNHTILRSNLHTQFFSPQPHL